MEHPIKMDDLGVPLFSETPICKTNPTHPSCWMCFFVTKEGMMKEMERLCLIMALVGCANIVAATLQGACFKTFSERQLGTCLFVGSGKVLQILPYDIQFFGEVRCLYIFGVEIPNLSRWPWMSRSYERKRNSEYGISRISMQRNQECGWDVNHLFVKIFDGRLGVFQTFAVFLFVW